MEKLFTLTIFSAIASLACAGLTSDDYSGYNMPIIPTAGHFSLLVTDTLAVSTDVSVSDYDLSLVVTSGDLTLDASEIIYNPDTTSWMFSPTVVGGSTPTYLRISASSFGFSSATGILFSNILFSGSGTLDLIDNTAVPEPSTIALVGLGALALCRKKLS